MNIESITAATNVVRFRRFKRGDPVQICYRTGSIWNHRKGIVRDFNGDRAMVQVDCVNTWQSVDDLKPVENWLGRIA